MIKDYQNGLYYVGAWCNSSWYKTLCNEMILDDFGDLIKVN